MEKAPRLRQDLYALLSQPEQFGEALAHIIIEIDHHDEVIGQAWLAGPNLLVTCAHVVDKYTRNPASLTIKFPSSGNRYVVQDIRLHPSYGREDERLNKFDIAVLFAELRIPEQAASPLPLKYDRELLSQTALSAIRYASHLEQFTTSLSPLAQSGSFLGRLRKSDPYHLLHDLALSPGDSGTPLFDGESVVAIHCGDTATIPGLNLPTTSIRLAVSTDTLTSLGIHETVAKSRQDNLVASGASEYMSLIVVSLVASMMAGFVAIAAAMILPDSERWSLSDNSSHKGIPLKIAFNRPLDDYKYMEELKIELIPEKNCFLYLYYLQDQFALAINPPPGSKIDAEVQAGRTVNIPNPGTLKLRADNTRGGKFHVLALEKNTPPVSQEMLDASEPDKCTLKISAKELLKRIEKLKQEDPDRVFHWELDAPVASKESPPESEKVQSG